jgi:tRNA-binding EMAP/Myf-like protein
MYMQEISKEIFEKYQVRKTRAQKTEFIEYIKQKFPDAKVEEGGFGKNRNIVIGDVASAKTVFTAHYDTCARLPFPNFITPKNFILYLLYGILIAIPFIALMAVIEGVLIYLSVDFLISYFLSLIIGFGTMIYVMMLGKPNPNTANDNTSGVLMLCELMAALTDEEKAKCAFVFFDNEENGLLGSAFFAKLHKKEMRDKLLVNLDCVGEGDNIMFVLSGSAKEYREKLAACFPATEKKKVLFESNLTAFYPSDQMNFKKTVAVAALKKKPVIGYYMDKIHTVKDTVCEEENLTFLCNGFVKFIKMI